MFLFGPLHVLALYAWKRISGVIEFDEGVYEEIQRRAALVPPAQRQVAISAMVKDRVAIGREVMLRKEAERKAEQERLKPLNFALGMFYVVCALLFIACLVK